MVSAIFVISGGKAEAAKTITGTSGSPTEYRALCDGGTPVDFAAYPSDVNFDGVNLTYNINIHWQRCTGTETRAYAIYGGEEVCPVSGTYGVAGIVTDCVKYIGSPEYSGPGNGLTCPEGVNGQCVTPAFSGARVSANQPSSAGTSITIPMSVTNNLWLLAPDAAGTWTVSNQMCQYYKTGANFTVHNDNRCITLTMSVSWVPTPVPPTISCGSVTTSPSNPEPGESFTLTASFSTDGGEHGGSNDPTLYSIQVAIPAAGVTAPGRYAAAYASIPWDAGSGSGTLPNISIGGASALPISIATSGVHPVTYTVVVDGADNTPQTCTGSVTVANKPYFKVYGGDVSVGKGSGGSACATNASAGVASWLRLYSGGIYAGSGTQLAAFALGSIDGFASGQERYTLPRKNLTFANSGSVIANSTYGGDLSPNNMPCAADYWSDTPAGSSLPAVINPASSTTYRSNTNSEIRVVPTGIGVGRSVTVYVDGDAYIASNIMYQPSIYTDIGQIPSFRLIVRGNIYVAPGVTELNGLFVATGKFYTCGQAYGQPTPSQLDGDCRINRLTVRGSVIADTIKLSRTGGTLAQSQLAEAWNHNVYSLGSDGPAERFIYTPEFWLTGDFDPGSESQSYRTLPPVL